MSLSYTYENLRSLDPLLDLVQVSVSTTYDASATSIVLDSGHGARLPAPATHGSFEMMWWDANQGSPYNDPNAERVRVTARTTDTLTVVRGQGNTSASTKNSGAADYVMSCVIHSGTIKDVALSMPLNPQAARFGAAVDGSTDDSAALQACFDALPSTGGIVLLPQGTMAIASNVNCTAPVKIIGAGRESSIVYASGDGYHAITFERSFEIQDVKFTRDNASTNTSWAALRLDYAVDTPVSQTRVHIQNCTIDGYNTGLYVDGGTSFDVEMVTLDDVFVDINSSSTGTSSHTQPTVYVARAGQFRVHGGKFVTYTTGGVDNIHTRGVNRVLVEGAYVEKGIGIQAESTYQELGTVEVKDCYFFNTDSDFHAMAGSYRVELVKYQNNFSKETRGVSGSAAVWVGSIGSAATSYDVGHVVISENFVKDSDTGCVKFEFGTSRTIKSVTMRGNYFKSWSSGAGNSGVYAAVTASGSGSFEFFDADNEWADGGSTGKSYHAVGSFNVENIGAVREQGVTSASDITATGAYKMNNAEVDNNLAVDGYFTITSTGRLRIDDLASAVTGSHAAIRKIPCYDSSNGLAGYVLIYNET